MHSRKRIETVEHDQTDPGAGAGSRGRDKAEVETKQRQRRIIVPH